MKTMDLTGYPIENIDWSPIQATKRKRNQGGRFQGSAAGILMLDCTVGIPPLPYQQAREAEAYFESFEGAIAPFQLIIPVVCFPSGAAKSVSANSITVVSGTGNTLITSGWPNNVVGILKPGDLVRLYSPTKMYKVATEVNSDANGIASIELTRALIAPPAGGEQLIFNPAIFTMVQPSAAQEYKIPRTKQSAFELDFEEVVLS